MTTDPTPTTGLITRFLSHGTKESSRRLIAFIAAVVLCVIAIALVEAMLFQAHKNCTISGILLTAFVADAGYLFWLAKTLFMKPGGQE